MSFFRFIAVFDDRDGKICSTHNKMLFDISALPVHYKCGDKFFVDGLNTDGSVFCEQSGRSLVTKPPEISAMTYLEIFKNYYNMGILAVFAFCPHSKISDCYKNANKAKKRLLKEIDDEFPFNIYVIDTKSVPAGACVLTFDTAMLVVGNRCQSALAYSLVKKNILRCKTFVLSFDMFFKKTTIVSGKITETDLRGSVDSFIFDDIACSVASELKKKGRKYAVSSTQNCTFLNNVLGRIIHNSNLPPERISVTSVPSALALGDNAMTVFVYTPLSDLW